MIDNTEILNPIAAALRTTETLNQIADALKFNIQNMKTDLHSVLVSNYDEVYNEELRQIEEFAGFGHCLLIDIKYSKKHLPESEYGLSGSKIYILLDRFLVPKAISFDFDPMSAGNVQGINSHASFYADFQDPIACMSTIFPLLKVVRTLIEAPYVGNCISRITNEGRIDYGSRSMYAEELLSAGAAFYPNMLLTETILNSRICAYGFMFGHVEGNVLDTEWTPYKLVTTLRHSELEEPDLLYNCRPVLRQTVNAVDADLDILTYRDIESVCFAHDKLATYLQKLSDSDYIKLLTKLEAGISPSDDY